MSEIIHSTPLKNTRQEVASIAIANSGLNEPQTLDTAHNQPATVEVLQRNFGRIWDPTNKPAQQIAIEDHSVKVEAVKQYLAKTAEAEQHEANSEQDSLTGLLNRRALPRKFKETIAYAKRHNGEKSVLVLAMDLDGFKAVNDTFGHNKGDEALKEVAKRLIKSARITDSAVRLGGDEFLMLFGSVDPNSVTDLVERIRNTIDFEVEGQNKDQKTLSLPIGTSLGYKEIKHDEFDQYTGNDDIGIQEVIEEVDQLVYDDKANHRKKKDLVSV